MTIGERIALKRREQGLSQEALGESLGVTRQSISKWEGDMTLPEIDKLITLSRLFNVSVGWLLGEERRENARSETGEEETAGEETESVPPPEELSEEQLRMVEEIVGRYLAVQPRPLSARQRRGLGLAAALVVLCFAAGFFSLSGQIKEMKEDNQYLRQAISEVNYSVSGQINGITRRVEEAFEDQTDLFTRCDAVKSAVDYRGGTVTFRVYALPKFYETGMSVTFLADNGRDTVKAVGSPSPSGMFEAPLICVLTDDISVYAVLQRSDGTEERQLLAQFCDLYSDTVPEVQLRSDGSGLMEASLSDGVLTVPEQLVMAIRGAAAFGPEAKIKAVQAGLFKNRHLVEWCEPTEVPEEYTGAAEDWLFFRMRERSVLLEPGDAVCYALVITDEYNRVTVWYGDLYNYESFQDREKGLPVSQQPVPADWEEYVFMEDWSLTKEFLERSPGHRF
jgi:transcriptional regulator with XRE-family HTH domain